MLSSQENDLVLLQKTLILLEEARANEVDPAQISLKSQTAFKIYVFRETMLWRYCAILKGIVNAMEEELYLPAIIL
ncbi:hypothetical protein JI58_06540 [Marinosulfonomonas sp. PRT-SC04]|nr:hypothetical protein JI58_06540 [Marinosulfonomonas sp. PRT-SC04]